MATWNLSNTKHHILICNVNSCNKVGAKELTQTIRNEVSDRNLDDMIYTTRTRCNGRCHDKCVVIHYSKGTWYKELKPEHVPPFVDTFLKNGDYSEKVSHSFYDQSFQRSSSDNSIVSYVLGYSNNNKLVFDTIIPAIQELKEGEQPLIHSERSYQYTSKFLKRMTEDAKMVHSMSRVGDNGPIEAFWVALKIENYLNKYDTYGTLEAAIDTYIAFYYNEHNQEYLNGLSPLEYRAQAA